MLDDLSTHLKDEKRLDLVNRLNNKNVDQAIPAECELMVLWMFRGTKGFQIEPQNACSVKLPDGYSEGLTGAPAVFEVAAFSDNSLSGEPQMDHCASQIIKFAESVSRDFGSHLSFWFREFQSGTGWSRKRNIAAPKDYQISESAKFEILRWMEDGQWKEGNLDLNDGGLSVVIKWNIFQQERWHRFQTSRPPRTYSLTANPLYDVLRKKRDQVKDFGSEIWKVIFVVEAGSRFLKESFWDSFGNTGEVQVTAQEITSHFLRKNSSAVDAVVFLSPAPDSCSGGFALKGPRGKQWKGFVFGKDDPKNHKLIDSLNSLLGDLPAPWFAGYTARSLFRQGAFSLDSHGSYPAVTWVSCKMKIEIRVSARALQDFLAGRINEEQLRSAFGEVRDSPGLGGLLQKGYIIKAARLEPLGIDEDDDHLVFELEKDPSANAFE